MRKVIAPAAVVFVSACQFGCDPKSQKELNKVIALHVYLGTETLGPATVAFIVGAAAPSGGPSALHAIGADRMIPAVVAGDDPDGPHFPFLLVPVPPHLADKFAVR